jgi:hypothetical protein
MRLADAKRRSLETWSSRVLTSGFAVHRWSSAQTSWRSQTSRKKRRSDGIRFRIHVDFYQNYHPCVKSTRFILICLLLFPFGVFSDAIKRKHWRASMRVHMAPILDAVHIRQVRKTPSIPYDDSFITPVIGHKTMNLASRKHPVNRMLHSIAFRRVVSLRQVA